MNFEEYLMESKVPLHDGVNLTKDSAHDEMIWHGNKRIKTKKMNVHLHGVHIGYIKQYSHQPYKKISGSRLVKPMALRLAWSAHTDSTTTNKHDAGFYRTSMGFYSDHDAANNLARHFEPHIQKAD